MTVISLEYGVEGCWEGEIEGDRLLVHHAGPMPLTDSPAAIRASLSSPIDFPPVKQAVVPGDRVVLALDRDVPSSAEIIAELCAMMIAGDILPENLLILQPASLTGVRPSDPRRLLPEAIRNEVVWKVHDPTVKDGVSYLASSAGGERIYLAREVVEADFLIPISRLGYDSLQGRRHVMGMFYPGLSNTEAFTKSLGQGHSELGPDDDRPLRQLITELPWLLGIQFAMQVLPSGRRGGAAQILAGQPEAITARGTTVLDDHWRLRGDERGETVLLSIPSTSGEPTGWEQLGAALDAARSLVESEGRIVVLSDLVLPTGPGAPSTPGIDILRSYRSPREALKPLRKAAPPDLLAASQIARATDWASVFLLSRLDSEFVEDLSMTPLQNDREVTRLISQCESCIVFDGAQHIRAELADD